CSPESLLFPYTTLFRSCHNEFRLFRILRQGTAARDEFGALHFEDSVRLDHRHHHRSYQIDFLAAHGGEYSFDETDAGASAADQRDRKSTRLNSSHGSIS